MALPKLLPPNPISMVYVGAKPATRREALACGQVLMSAKALRQIRTGNLPKGDALQAARLAGLMSAKKTSDIIPLCHPIAVDSVDVRTKAGPKGVFVEALARATARTGVEMEALTAVSAACLTIYDMAKSIDPQMTIGPIYLKEKRGGLSGDFRRIKAP